MSDLQVIKSLSVTDATLTATSVPEADYAAWSGATTYALSARVIKSHKIWESVQASNLNQDPDTTVGWWLEVSPTNRWKLFDLSSTTQTVVDTADYYEITPAQAISAVALVNMAGLIEVRVRLTDPVFGVVYDTTTDVSPAVSEASWYAWFFELRVEQTEFVATDLPSYSTAVLRVDVTSTVTGLIGALVFGIARSIGPVQYGASLGLTDYSRKERNDWGDTYLVQRAYSKTLDVDMVIDNDQLNNIYRLLSDLRSTPALWIPSQTTRYNALTVFGYYQDFSITIQYHTMSACRLTIEGLT